MGEFDGVSGVAVLAGAREQRQCHRPEGDDVVETDEALVTKTKAAGEIETAWEGAEVPRRISGGTGETLMVGVANNREDEIGLLQSRGPCETELLTRRSWQVGQRRFSEGC